jgi:NAD-dependent SIR2 family protein deacetylase
LDVDLESRAPNPSLPLLDPLETASLDPRGFVERIIWGWKRDSASPRLTRLIYFSGRQKWDESGLRLDDAFLFYAHQGEKAAMEPLLAPIEGRRLSGPFAATTRLDVLDRGAGQRLLRIVSGRPTGRDLYRLSSLAAREPDPPQETPPRVPATDVFDLRELGITGCDLLAGSGLSYEAGLPMLKDVHDLFWVDDGFDGFCLGAKDHLPRLLLDDQEKMFRRFSQWHIQAARTAPSVAHQCLAGMRRAGLLHNVFTDNVDRLFTLAGIEDYQQVRGSGVINEFFPARFSPQSDALLVVGVSADRRGIIAQARERGLRLVVVNPYLPVSPGAKNLNYLQAGDVYYRQTAGEALPRVYVSTLGQPVTAL